MVLFLLSFENLVIRIDFPHHCIFVSSENWVELTDWIHLSIYEIFILSPISSAILWGVVLLSIDCQNSGKIRQETKQIDPLKQVQHTKVNAISLWWTTHHFGYSLSLYDVIYYSALRPKHIRKTFSSDKLDFYTFNCFLFRFIVSGMRFSGMKCRFSFLMHKFHYQRKTHDIHYIQVQLPWWLRKK